MHNEIITDAMKIRQILHKYFYKNLISNCFESIAHGLINPRLDAEKLIIYAQVTNDQKFTPSKAMYNFFCNNSAEIKAVLRAANYDGEDPHMYLNDEMYTRMLYDTMVMGDTYLIRL